MSKCTHVRIQLKFFRQRLKLCYTFIHKNFNKKYECKNKSIGSIGEGADVLSSNLS